MLHAIPDLMHLIRTVLAFVVVLGVLVFVHELGHYLAARWMGVHVETFSIGFGRAIFGWTDRHGTAWKVAWLPLGGYVRLHGQERPEDVTDETRASWQAGRTFHEKAVGRRAVVIAAGPIANFILAMVLFAALFGIAGRPVGTAVVGEVVAGGAAEAAGLQKGDRILTIDGSPITRFDDIQRIVVSHPGQKMSVVLHRGEADLTLQATPEARDDGHGKQVGLLGIRSGGTEFEPLSPGAAVVAGVVQTWDVTTQTLQGVGQMLSGARGTDDLGGPLRIAQLSGEVAELGISSLVSFIAVLSVNLGLINLFPIPILDGGHLVFYLVEAIRGRPLPPRALEYGFRAGFALLACLFVFATWNDLSHFGLMKWVASLIG